MSPHRHLSPRVQAIAALSKFGTLLSCLNAQDAPRHGYHVYLVTNGEELLQLGSGKNRRMQGCLRGGLAVKHAKAYVCALAEVAFGRPNQYLYLECESKEEASRIERTALAELGIQINVQCASLIQELNFGQPCSIREVTLHLFQLILTTEKWRTLTEPEQRLSRELCNWVVNETFTPSHGVRVTRGDLLQGRTLEQAGLTHLIAPFLKLTDNYLRYGRHADPELAAQHASISGHANTPGVQSRAPEIHALRKQTPDRPKVGAVGCRSLPDSYRPASQWSSSLVGNDESNRSNTSRIAESKVGANFLLQLSWRSTGHEEPCFVGNFELNIPVLLASGVLAREDTPEKRVRLIIQHDRDGSLWIRRNQSAPAVLLADAATMASRRLRAA